MAKPRFHFPDAVLYEDDDLLVLNKPSGIASLQERYSEEPDLLRMARQYHPRIKVCHRLDKITTGVLLFAKNFAAYRAIAYQFEFREVEKRYHALVHGTHSIEGVRVDVPLGLTPKGLAKVDFELGKEASTLVKSLQTFRHCTLLECMPLTGRQHQIRLHLAYLKMPIVGDDLYGGKPLLLSELKRHYKFTGEGDERPLNDRPLLHAHCLKVKHPSTNEWIEWHAPYDKPFGASLQALEKWDRQPDAGRDYAAY